MELTTEIIKKKIPEVTKKFIDLLNLQEWSYSIKFEKTLDNGTAADCNIDEEYLNFLIRISEEELEICLKEKNQAEIADWIIHELVHVIVDPLYFVAVDAVTNTSLKFLSAKREQTVTRITNILMKGLDAEKIWQ